MADKTANPQNTAPQESWFDYLPAEENQDELKAKQWRTEHRATDDESSSGNLHYGTEDIRENRREIEPEQQNVAKKSQVTLPGNEAQSVASSPPGLSNSFHAGGQETTQATEAIKQRSAVRTLFSGNPDFHRFDIPGLANHPHAAAAVEETEPLPGDGEISGFSAPEMRQKEPRPKVGDKEAEAPSRHAGNAPAPHNEKTAQGQAQSRPVTTAPEVHEPQSPAPGEGAINIDPSASDTDKDDVLSPDDRTNSEQENPNDIVNDADNGDQIPQSDSGTVAEIGENVDNENDDNHPSDTVDNESDNNNPLHLFTENDDNVNLAQNDPDYGNREGYFALGGDDRVEGGDLDDRIHGNAGNDTLLGGGGDDTLYGDAGNDKLYGGKGNDVLIGGAGNDHIYGGAGDDTINAGAGNDYVDARGGQDTISAGEGNDYIYADGTDKIDGGEGYDTANYSYAAEGVNVDMRDGGNAQNIERVYGSKHDDSITGSDADEYIHGGDGDDTINAVGGDDRIYGGHGEDTIILAGNQDEYNIVKNSDGSFTVQDTVDNRDDDARVAGVEKFQFADGTVAAEDLTLSSNLIDGAVAGVEYTTSSGLRGFTDENGAFTFKAGDEVTFSIGGVTLGVATAEDVATGQTFLQDIADVERTDLNDEYTENMATFLQSLDNHSDAYDGIVITNEIREALADVHLDLRTASEEDVKKLVEQLGKKYVSEDAAMEHVEDMLVANTDLDHDDFQEHLDDAIDQQQTIIAALPTEDVRMESSSPANEGLQLHVPSVDLLSGELPSSLTDGHDSEPLATVPESQGEDSIPGNDQRGDDEMSSAHIQADSGYEVGSSLLDDLPSVSIGTPQATEDDPQPGSDSGIIGQEDEILAVDSTSSEKDPDQHQHAQPENKSAEPVAQSTMTKRTNTQPDTGKDSHADTAAHPHGGNGANGQSETQSATAGDQSSMNDIGSVDEIGALPSIADAEIDPEPGQEDHAALSEDNGDPAQVQQESSPSGHNELLDQFSVTDTGMNGAVDASGVEQFMVSDTPAMDDEIPPMDGIDVTPDQAPVPEPEDAGLGMDDAVLPDDVQDSAPQEHEVVAV